MINLPMAMMTRIFPVRFGCKSDTARVHGVNNRTTISRGVRTRRHRVMSCDDHPASPKFVWPEVVISVTTCQVASWGGVEMGKEKGRGGGEGGEVGGRGAR